MLRLKPLLSIHHIRTATRLIEAAHTFLDCLVFFPFERHIQSLDSEKKES
jgi:hypothetical protein